MSSSSVYQGFQSCLGPRVIEPRVLRLKLAPPGSNLSPPSQPESHHHHDEKPLINNECDKKDTKTNTGGWNFLQALSNPSSLFEKTAEDNIVYVHPTVKGSSSMLSEKSLEMCTESLGSETGSNANESSDEASLFSFESNTNNNSSFINTSVVVPSRRVNRACNFPPPLTSITDFGGVHVRPHREDGRLILEAVASPSPHPYFHAERSDGRLRICLYESPFDSECDDDDEAGDDEEVDEEWSHEGEVQEEEEEEDNDEDNDDDEMQNKEGCGEEEESGVEEYVENVEGEMGVNKFGRPSRCKESENRDIFGDGYFERPSLSLCL